MSRCLLITLPLLLSLANPSNAVLAVDNLSPVTRVVNLLQGLQKQITEEGKTEEELFEKFVCWAKSVISAKEASNAEAASRVQALTKYISDLDNGRIELTSERVDLEKELEQLHADIELAGSLRLRENQDFESAKEEMEQAIAALTAAIDVLTTATKDHTDGVLLGLRGGLESGSTSAFGSRAAQAAALSHAVRLGQKFLTRADALFLQRLLTADVPTPDWRKLNRPATFKQGYKARSFKIQSVLAKLLETFETNLAEAKRKESGAQATYDSLMQSKGSEKSTAQDALSKLETEKGAAGLSKAGASDEVSQLQTQISDDEKYVQEVKKALGDKRTEWDARKALRTSELGAISKAIAILHSDDARDLFKKSFASQGYSLLQEEETEVTTSHLKRGNAAAIMRAASQSSHDRRLVQLASHLEAGGHFDEVLLAIDNMLTLLKTEETGDLQKKEDCEKNRAKDTREAALTARKMDELTDTVTGLLGEIQELKENIATKTSEVEAIDAELKEAARLRAAENAEFLKAKKDDEDARDLVVSALQVLKTFYESNGLMLTQQAPEVVAGAAPPPPPSTWEGPYMGKTAESDGILKILTMIKEDIEKDLSTAASEEAKAVQLYTTTRTELQTERGNLVSLISSLEISKGQKEQEVQTTKTDRRLKQQALNAVMNKIEGAIPGCTFFTVNFAVRTRNRQMEIDGLLKAKAILSGAKFAD